MGHSREKLEGENILGISIGVVAIIKNLIIYPHSVEKKREFHEFLKV